MRKLSCLLVLLSLVTTNVYVVDSYTLTANVLTQKGYNNQNTSVYIYDDDIDEIDPNALSGYDKVTQFMITSKSLRSIDIGIFKYTVNLQYLALGTRSLNKFTNSKNTILPSLTEFTLTSNLTSLNKAMFNGFPALLRFETDFGYNGTGILKTIDVHTFESLSKLGYIFLRFNLLTSFEYLQIPKNMKELNLGWNNMNHFVLSRTMGVLEVLRINNNRFKSFKSMDFTFLANLTELYLSNNPHAYPYEIAGHMKPLVKLEHVELSNLNITTIDSNYFKNNTKLQYIDLSLNKISSLDSGAFKGLNDLNSVILYSNSLTKIASGTVNNSNLYFIHLARNQISQIDSLSFCGYSPYPNVFLNVDLSYNKLTKILPKIFNNRFSSIWLSYNQITEIENTTFDGISQVQGLSLNNNKIEKIAPGSFNSNLLGLKYLYLSYNNLTEISLGSFVGKMLTLDLSNNRIEKIEESGFNNLSLNYLDLSYNHLTEISLGLFRQMVYLDLSNNRIEKIEESGFNYSSLISISLNNNSLTQINKTTFAGQNALLRIYLNNNNLSTIESGSFANLTSLKWIYLENNQLTQLDSSIFAGSNNLLGIYLKGNQNLSTTNIQSLCPPAASYCHVYYYY